jgi:hypothetical protein
MHNSFKGLAEVIEMKNEPRTRTTTEPETKTETGESETESETDISEIQTEDILNPVPNCAVCLACLVVVPVHQAVVGFPTASLSHRSNTVFT